MKTVSDSTVKTMISDTLKHFINNRLMFTAWDVTNKVRQDNPTIHIFHDVVRNYIEEEFDKGLSFVVNGYDRQLIPIANPHPWLYYVEGIHDPDDYKGSPVKTTNSTSANFPKPNVIAGVPPQAKSSTIAVTFNGFRN